MATESMTVAGAEPLSERREAFCRLIVSGVEPDQAVVRAGSKSKTPDKIAAGMMRAPDVLARIGFLQRELADDERMKQSVEEQKDRIIDELSAIAFSDIAEVMEFGPLIQTQEQTPDEAYDSNDSNPTSSSGAYIRLRHSTKIDTRAIKAVEIGKNGSFKVQFYDKLRAQQQLAQILGIAEKDKDDGDLTMEEVIVQRTREVDKIRETIINRRLTKHAPK